MTSQQQSSCQHLGVARAVPGAIFQDGPKLLRVLNFLTGDRVVCSQRPESHSSTPLNGSPGLRAVAVSRCPRAEARLA